MRQAKPEFNIKDLKPQNLAVIIAQWNSNYNQSMLKSFAKTIDFDFDTYEVPGAFEIPLLALKLAEQKKYQAIVCFATVIKGDTLHFEIVANESARGLMQVMLTTGVPIINGILACNTAEQAEIRASERKEDKGKEIALTLMSLLGTLHQVDKSCE
jgi:6,7-dimethyl-8-ribityllumazine synthase